MNIFKKKKPLLPEGSPEESSLLQFASLEDDDADAAAAEADFDSVDAQKTVSDEASTASSSAGNPDEEAASANRNHPKGNILPQETDTETENAADEEALSPAKSAISLWPLFSFRPLCSIMSFFCTLLTAARLLPSCRSFVFSCFLQEPVCCSLFFWICCRLPRPAFFPMLRPGSGQCLPA